MDIEHGETKSAVYNALAALQAVWCAEIKEGRSMIDLGVTAVRKAEQHRARVAEAAAKRRDDCQRKADVIWRRHPKWSASQVARTIDVATADTIRRHIKRPPPK
jgi:hypothetical protein